MKKIILFILSLFFISFTYAINFNLKYCPSVKDTNWIIQIPPIYINFENKITTWFSLKIRKWAWMIFNFSPKWKLSDDHKELYFSWKFSGNLVLTWISLRIYDKYISDNLMLEVWGKTFNSTRCIFFNPHRYDYDDKVLPFPPQKIYYKFTKKWLNLYFQHSPDLDILYYVLNIYKNNKLYKSLRVSTSTIILDFIKDFKNNNWSIELFAKDRYFLSSWVKLGIKKPILQANTTNTGSKTTIKKTDNIIKKNNSKPMCIQMLQSAKDPKTWECKIFSTPCDVPSWWIKVNSCKVSLFEKRYKFTFKTNLFNTFEKKFDKKIEEIIKNIINKEKLLKIRNWILQTLKNYEDKTYTNQETIDELKKYVIEFKKVIK